LKPLSILIAEKHNGVRRTLRALCEEKPHWEVCCESTDGEHAVEEAERQKPDAALLEISIPRLNGLEVARRIRRVSPNTRILLLSNDQVSMLDEEARRAGADGAALKYDSDRWMAWIQSVGRSNSGRAHLAGSVIGEQRHIAAFFSTVDQRYRVLAPFVAEGLKYGERAYHIIAASEQQAHLDTLARAGVHVGRAGHHDQIDLASWEETYLRTGDFDQTAMVECVREIFAKTSFSQTRAIANMEWALKDLPGVRDLPEYESRINDLMPEIEGVIICAYLAPAFGGQLLLDVMRAHPALLIGETLLPNPFYLPPDVLIDELHRRFDH
jgi:DNA-binding NarL/FixJ family response regulator